MSEGFSGLGKSRKSIRASASSKHDRINGTEHKNIKKAFRFMQQGNYKDAEVIYKKLIKEKTRNYVVFQNLAEICHKKGRIEEMIILLKEAFKLNPDYPEGLLNMGAALMQLGKSQEGIAYYKKALAIDPNHLKALTNLGVALRQLGKPQEGIAYYKKALAMDPNHLKALTNLGAALVDIGKPQEGIAYYKKALAIDPNHLKALTNLGAALVQLGKLQESINYSKKALAINPNWPAALTNLGTALVQLGKIQESIAYYKKALAIDPDSPAALTNLGAALVTLGKTQESIAYYKKALAIDPDSPAALTNLGAALVTLGKTQEGIAYHKKALAIDPDSPVALTNLGAALADLGKTQEGIAYHKKALAIDPDSPRSLANLGVALILSGELQEASNTCRKAISLRPDYIPAHWSLSFSLLSSGDYENGWKEYEWRFRVEDTLHAHLPQLKKWNGSSHCSRDNLVLVSEQGFGDIMQFMRYILYLRKRGMIVAFCTRTKLHGLIQSSGITSEIYSPEEVHQLTTREWLPLLSLPMHLKVRPDNPLIQEPYIKAPAERILYWKQKLSSEKRPIIGINWQGNASTEIHMLRGRSLPLETFTPLTENIDASFLSLQKGDGSEQLTDCKFLDRFVDCQEEINQTWDFVENAAIIMNCDLIITMDTSVAHLAGGLGKTTWLLLHKPCDWRWGMEGDTTFWYPSMRLFRQRERGNWQEVMDRVAMALQGAYSQRFIQAAR
ncbi:MAG: tetratricopeptide repeat protein [Cyanobacteria bacterium MAG IRC3_bin_20]|nr:tetratricopeptide repeat protein [Cyanobacteria bacterium MAG IRC3_bin_20]